MQYLNKTNVCIGAVAATGGFAAGYYVAKQSKNQNSEDFDIIIVGSGPAGCVLARKLYDQTNKRILLLEAGLNFQNDPNVRDPANLAVPPNLTPDGTVGGLIGNDNKYYYTTLSKAMPSYLFTKFNLLRGCLFGGGSSSNYMLTTRGGPEAYAKWEAAIGGNSKYWSLDNIYKTITSMETFVGYSQTPDSRGTAGPIYVLQNNPAQDSASNSNLLNALANTAGYPSVPIVPDYNANMECCGSAEWQNFLQLTNNNTAVTRSSADYAYLNLQEMCQVHPNGLSAVSKDPQHRLKILFSATATKILFNAEKEATGVKVIWNQEQYTFGASDYVISSAGLNSVALLQQSGVGDPVLLNSFNIPVVSPNRAVGRGLMNQPHCGVAAKLNVAPNGNAPILYLPYPKGGGYTATERAIEILVCNPQQLPPSALFSATLVNEHAQELYGGSDVFAIVVNINPRSNDGHLEINSTDAAKNLTQPNFSPNLCSNPVDMDVIVHGIQRFADAVHAMGGTMTYPSESVISGGADAIKTFVIVNGYTQAHDACGARMGKVDGTKTSGDTFGDAVDERLNVYGTRKLKVVDLMISPVIPSAHPTQAALAIGSIASQIILDEYSS